MNGPGKYDDLCTKARLAAGPDAGAALIIVNGIHGQGFSCQMSGEMLIGFPKMLRVMADSIERQMPKDLMDAAKDLTGEGSS